MAGAGTTQWIRGRRLTRWTGERERDSNGVGFTAW
jgi:hypothetical protein